MTVADVFFVHQRGLMNTIYVWTSGIGGSLAPVAAGYITESQGWRWVWWWCALFFGLCIILFVFTYEETKYTYPKINNGISPTAESEPTQLNGLIEKFKEAINTVSATESGDENASPNSSTPAINPNIRPKTYWERHPLVTTSPGDFKKFSRHAWQPAIILLTIPAVFYMSLVLWSHALLADSYGHRPLLLHESPTLQLRLRANRPHVRSPLHRHNNWCNPHWSTLRLIHPLPGAQKQGHL